MSEIELDIQQGQLSLNQHDDGKNKPSKKVNFKLEIIIDAVVAIVLLFVGFMLSFFGTGIQHSREYWVEDHINTHTFTENETMPVYVTVIMVAFLLIIPFLVELVLECISNKSARRSLLYLFCLVVSFSGCFFIVESLKIVVARPRPDFYSRCEIDDPGDGISPLLTSNCNTTDKSRRDEANLSFPSGHSSYSMFGSAICSFYIMKVFLFTEKGKINKDMFFARCVVCFLPLIPAIFTAISRTFDYRHFPSDVITGMIIGLIFGFLGIYLFDIYLNHWNGSSINIRRKRRSDGYVIDVVEIKQ